MSAIFELRKLSKKLYEQSAKAEPPTILDRWVDHALSSYDESIEEAEACRYGEAIFKSLEQLSSSIEMIYDMVILPRAWAAPQISEFVTLKSKIYRELSESMSKAFQENCGCKG